MYFHFTTTVLCLMSCGVNEINKKNLDINIKVKIKININIINKQQLNEVCLVKHSPPLANLSISNNK